MINNFSENSAKLKKVEAYKEDDRWFLRLIYEYQNDNGEIFEMEIPKMVLPIVQNLVPDIITSNDSNCPWGKAYYIRAFSSYVQGVDCIPMLEGKSTIVDNAEGCFIRKSICRRMTVEDIEKELGYKIEIVDKEVNNND